MFERLKRYVVRVNGQFAGAYDTEAEAEARMRELVAEGYKRFESIDTQPSPEMIARLRRKLMMRHVNN